ncbi:metallophosphoesterase [Brachybacterium sp. MASK1Z-5]|uniref:Metallophosphoesterase n=1 Tax=Brachybacterium halotolerans TaxID=2795215 RepID=A0ABS1BF54_9MICO|nr:metallophosphoesterase [Brachybacterium halotolerans]MBK0332787.1 metallophosphoesterase [Brachybacterium halotolerans]
MRILQLTDTHLYGDPASRHYDRIDTAAALQALLARVRGMEGVDVVVHTGDASDDGSVASYRLLHEILDPFAAELGAELVVTMGNHDVPAAYTEVAGPGDHGGPWQDRVHALPGGGLVIVLDSSVPGAGYGHLDPEQLEWLRGVLGSPGDAPTVLAIHHPPLVGATPLLRGLDLDGLDALADVLAGSDVRAILSGHYHHPMTGSIAGIPVLVCPGITNVVDPLAPGGVERAGARSGAQLVEIDAPGAPGVRATSAEWASGGDTLEDPERPVYEFGPDVVAQILDAAGR